MNPDLQTISDYIVQRYHFDSENYPPLAGLSEQERLQFSIRHLALHFSKTAGKIATASEGADHGGGMDIQELKVNLAKSLINTLRFAELVKMSDMEFVELIKKNYD